MEATPASLPNQTVIFHLYSPTVRTTLAVLYFSMACIGIVGNIFVLAAVGLSRKLRIPMNVFVVNLAISDLFTCLTFPVFALYFLNYLNQHLQLCLPLSVIQITSVGSSVANISFIAINRCVCITASKQVFRRLFRWRNTIVMATCTWLLGPMYLLLTLSYLCDISLFPNRPAAVTWFGPLIFSSALLIVLVCYMIIFVHVRRHESRSTIQRPNRLDLAISKNLLLVVCAFYICLTPNAVYQLLQNNRPSYTAESRTTFQFIIILLLSNSIVNPIIYAARHPIFREVFTAMITRQWARIPQN